ncbi:hypothetical protein OROMI_026338 [Orobanche minor]
MARVPLGCEPVVGPLTPSRKREYRVTNRLQEGKRPIYAVVFNFIDSSYFNAFATAGGNRVTVYQCLEGGVIAVLQSYIDEDIRKMNLSTLLAGLAISMELLFWWLVDLMELFVTLATRRYTRNIKLSVMDGVFQCRQ